MSLVALIIQFMLVGLLTFGGGLVAVTLLYDTFVTTGVITSDFFYQMITISESTPGPIAINLATYLCFSQYGVIGGILTTFAFILPSLFIIWISYPAYQKHRDNRILQSVMVGLRTAIFGMILVTLVRMGLTLIESSMETPIQAIALFLLTLMLFKPLKNRPYLLLMVGAVFGIFFL